MIALEETITDAAGNALDGEILSPFAPVLPSGDGVPGGIAALRFHVLQGDVNQDGRTDANDVVPLATRLGACAGDAGFDSGADLNGDGCINVLDVQILTNAVGSALVPLSGISPTVDSTDPPVGAPLADDLSTLSITWTGAARTAFGHRWRGNGSNALGRGPSATIARAGRRCAHACCDVRAGVDVV